MRRSSASLSCCLSCARMAWHLHLHQVQMPAETKPAKYTKTMQDCSCCTNHLSRVLESSVISRTSANTLKTIEKSAYTSYTWRILKSLENSSTTRRQCTAPLNSVCTKRGVILYALHDHVGITFPTRSQISSTEMA